MTEAEWDECAVVGRVARAHGIRGHVIVNPDTDFVDDRFRVGAELLARRGGRVERLRVTAMRIHLGRPIVAIEGVETMNDAQAMAGLELRVPVAELAPLPSGTFYRHDLIGCRVETTGGDLVGEVVAVEGSGEASRLVVATPRGEELVPLASEMVPVVDPPARRIVIAAPDGLLGLNETARSRRERQDWRR